MGRKEYERDIRQQTVEEWNEIRRAELEIEEREALDRETDLAFFPRPTGFICSNCGQMRVFDEAHVDHDERFWKRQTICYSCKHTVYRYL